MDSQRFELVSETILNGLPSDGEASNLSNGIRRSGPNLLSFEGVLSERIPCVEDGVLFPGNIYLNFPGYDYVEGIRRIALVEDVFTRRVFETMHAVGNGIFLLFGEKVEHINIVDVHSRHFVIVFDHGLQNLPKDRLQQAEKIAIF